MRRRQVLRGVVVGAAVGLGGCAGYRVVDADAADREERRLNRTRQRLAARNETVEDLRAEVERLRERGLTVTEQLRTYYDEGYDRATSAETAYDEAARRYEREEYRAAVDRFLLATGRYHAGNALFQQAVFLARDRGLDGPASVASGAASYTTQRGLAADLFAEAASAYAAGDTETGDSRAEQARGHRDEAATHDLARVAAFEGRLPDEG
jgi:hypothetical protein